MFLLLLLWRNAAWIQTESYFTGCLLELLINTKHSALPSAAWNTQRKVGDTLQQTAHRKRDAEMEWVLDYWTLCYWACHHMQSSLRLLHAVCRRWMMGTLTDKPIHSLTLCLRLNCQADSPASQHRRYSEEEEEEEEVRATCWRLLTLQLSGSSHSFNFSLSHFRSPPSALRIHIKLESWFRVIFLSHLQVCPSSLFWALLDARVSAMMKDEPKPVFVLEREHMSSALRKVFHHTDSQQCC